MRKKFIGILTIMMVLSFGKAMATTYYVSPSGNNNNPGTSSQPWKTIAYAVSSNSPVGAGDVVILKNGIYSYTNEGVSIEFEKSGTPGNPITLKAENKHMAIVQGSGNESGINWHAGQFRLFKKSHWVLDGIKLQNCPDWGIIMISCTDIFVKNCWTYMTDASGIIAMPETNTENFNYNIRYHYCKVEYAQYGMVKWSEDHPGELHTGSPYQEALDMWKVDGFEIIGCEVSYSTKEGIDAKSGTKNGIIRDCKVHHLNHLDIYMYTGAGIYLDGASNVDVYNNITYDNRGPGISVADEKGGTTKNVNVYNNIVYGNCLANKAQAGIRLMNDSENVHCYNNTVVGSSQEYGIKTSQNCLTQCSVNNNLVVGNGVRQIDIASVGNIVVKNNVVGGNAPIYYSSAYDGNGTVENNKIVTDLNSVFVNYNYLDLHLKSGSPAIDWALSTMAPSFDYDYVNRPQGAGDDAGAYEYSSGTNIPVTGVSISNCPSSSLNVNGTYTLTAVVSPSNATNKTVTWSSSNISVATVNSSGVVTAVAEGTATITVTAQDGGFIDNCSVTVQSPPVGDGFWFETECATFGASTAWVEQTDANASNDKYIVVPEAGNKDDSPTTDESVSFTFNISESGTYVVWVRTIAEDYGANSYFFKWDDGSFVTTNVSVDLNWSWQLNGTSFTLSSGAHTLYISPREDGLKIDKVLIQQSGGSAPSGEGYTVTNCGPTDIHVTGVSISNCPTSELQVGNTATLTAVISPSDATNQNVSWSSSNTSVATVISSGLVTAVAEGTTTITVTTEDGGFTANCSVTVQPPPVGDGFWFETECATFGASTAWVEQTDANASNDKYIVVPTSGIRDDSPTVEESGAFTFNVSESGTYEIWTRVIAIDAGANSCHIKIDGGSFAQYDFAAGTATWNWQMYASAYTLSSGEHTLYISPREDGLKIDKVLVQQSGGSTPSGEGGSATNCVKSGVFYPNSVFGVYPNPLEQGHLNIELGSEQTDLITIHDASGRNLFSSSNTSGSLEIEKSELSKGLNIITIISGKNAMSYKIIVK